MRTQCAHVPKAHIAPEAYRLPKGKYRKSVRIYIALVCLLRQTNQTSLAACGSYKNSVF